MPARLVYGDSLHSGSWILFSVFLSAPNQLTAQVHMVDAVSINGGQVIAVGSEGGYRNLSCADEQVISFLLDVYKRQGKTECDSAL